MRDDRSAASSERRGFPGLRLSGDRAHLSGGSRCPPMLVSSCVALPDHESRDDAVEGRSLESESLLAGAERAEVLRRLRDDVGAELHHDLAGRLATDYTQEAKRESIARESVICLLRRLFQLRSAAAVLRSDW
jgi:hypothetical protein